MSIFKKFNENDIATTNGTVNESIILKRALMDGYKKFENHFFSGGSYHPYFATMFDNLETSPWSNRLLTVAYGMHTGSTLYSYALASAIDHKSKIYRLYAKRLLGSEDNIFQIDNKQAKELIFISLARNQMKDRILFTPNTSSVLLGFYYDNNSINNPGATVDSGSAISYSTDFGEALQGYGGTYRNIIESVSSSVCGQIYYEQGTAVLIPHKIFMTGTGNRFSGTATYSQILFSGNANLLYGICGKFSDLNYSNNSSPQVTFFKCQLDKEEFNYTSNPSCKLSDGQIVPMSGSDKQVQLTPTTYITQIGLCNELGEILAVARATSPIKKDFTKNLSITVRLIT